MSRSTSKPAEQRRTLRRDLSFGTDIIQVNKIRFQRKWDDETGVNLSTGGFQCCSLKKLPERAILHCLMLFPKPYDQDLVRVEAKLVWQKNLKSGLWQHGFVFRNCSPEHRRIMEQVLQH